MVVVIDLAGGNLGSLFRAVGDLGFKVMCATDPQMLRRATTVILPGVGTAHEAMRRLRQADWLSALNDWNNKGAPILGICLGMQLMGIHSEEGDVACLSLLPIKTALRSTGRPQIGWYEVERSGRALVENGPFFFAHSYEVVAPIDLAVRRTVDPSPSVAIVESGNLCGVQFHPEKSQRAGRQFLGHYIESCQRQ